MGDLNLVSLYTGAGGLDYGFEAAGFRVAAAIEMDHDACMTIRRNRGWPILEKEIQHVSSDELIDDVGAGWGSIDLVVGGPPCQPFSKSSYWVNGDSKRMNDHRAFTLHEFMRVVEDLRPEVFLLENVHGISYTGKEEGFRFLRNSVAGINRRQGTSYEVSWDVLNAADYGVPQLRRRFFMVGHRDGRRFRFPKPTHYNDENGKIQASITDVKAEPYRKAWDAIGDLNDEEHEEDLSIKGRWADLVPSIPEGENYLWHTSRKGGLPLFGWRTRYWSFLLKLAKAKPSWTLQAQPGSSIGPFHWKSRQLSAKEMARIQTFPENIEIVGGKASAQRQLGNAVPSLLAEVLAREISDQLLGCRPHGNLRLTVPKRRPIPPPEPIEPVHEKYLALVGDHPDHPGEGRGPKAAR